ncbi:hypothetical protein ACFX13_036393 [Malus domestica]
MEPNADHGFFERINLQGKNTGASFSIRPGIGAESSDCCCINIYINNNVQGASSSVLHGSCVKMKDPGVYLFFGDVKFSKSFLLRTNKAKRKRKKRKDTLTRSKQQPGFWTTFLFVSIPFLLLLSLFC